MDGFVRAHLAFDGPDAGPATMGYYERADIPFYYALAEAFTICENYHCSMLGPTDPNRLYSMSASIDPDGEAGGPLVETESFEARAALAGRFTWATMPEQLSAAGVSWKIYTGAERGVEDNVLSYFRNYQTNAELAELAFEALYPCDFSADLANEELPQVSWILASFEDTEHPGFSTAAAGEYTVAPPVAPEGTPGEYLTAPDITGDSGGIAGPIGLGFRVPMLVVSPFSRGGFLCPDVFDHTSILRFLEARFGVEVPNLSEWRREATGDLTSAFNFAGPDKNRPKLPAIELTRAQRQSGGCVNFGSVTVPPNSLPEEAAREWQTPSGP
jgi:phospholipase C